MAAAHALSAFREDWE